MGSYTGTADRSQRAKAIAGVAAVHIALAAVILSGLNVAVVRHAVEKLTTINVVEPPPPPPVEPPPSPKPDRTRLEEGAAGKKAEPSPVVAPKPRIPQPSPLPAAPVAGTGSATSAGASTAGSGTGAGGSGTGRGGGGSGDFTGFTPARRLTKIPDSEYGRLSSSGIASGAVGVTILVNTNGSVSNCRIARSSGQPAIDALMCRLTLRYVRFAPARDPSGKPVAQDITFFPNWQRRGR